MQSVVCLGIPTIYLIGMFHINEANTTKFVPFQDNGPLPSLGHRLIWEYGEVYKPSNTKKGSSHFYTK